MIHRGHINVSAQQSVTYELKLIRFLSFWENFLASKSNKTYCTYTDKSQKSHLLWYTNTHSRDAEGHGKTTALCVHTAITSCGITWQDKKSSTFASSFSFSFQSVAIYPSSLTSQQSMVFMEHSDSMRETKKYTKTNDLDVRTWRISSICIIEGGTLARGRDRASSSFKLSVMMFLKWSRANWRTDGSFPWRHTYVSS